MDTSRSLGNDPDDIAPDGMEVRLLATGVAGSMAHFRLPAGRAGRAVMHVDLEEIWYCLAGKGRMWLSATADIAEPPMRIRAGTSFVIPPGASFQLDNTGNDPIDFIGVTVPPWPGAHGAAVVSGPYD
jgi:mannose-6-phosphate isomerase-like protein (cupin superfamily)